MSIPNNVNVTPGTGTTVLADSVTDGTLGAGVAQVIKIWDATVGSTNKLIVSAQGAASVYVTDNAGHTLPTLDAAARAGFVKVTDGTNTAAVKAASTAPVATDPAAVVTISPNGNTVGVSGVASTGGVTVLPTASKTRPANTTAYTAGQVIAESTTAATVWTFANCARANGGTGTIFGAMLTDTVKQTTTLQANLWLFNVSPTVQNDGVAFAPSTGDLANLVAVIPLATFNAANANGVLTANELNRPFKCAVAATSLFGVLVAANNYTPASGEVFGATLLIGQD